MLLGSNLGERKKVLEAALEDIKEKAGALIKRSSFYETEPWGFETDKTFLNIAVIIDTKLKPHALLEVLLEIEQGFGRTRNKDKYESRSLDIDILFYEDYIIDDKDLVIPHPRIEERMFALKPLMEIAESFMHPVLNISIKQLTERCRDKLNVKLFQD